MQSYKNIFQAFSDAKLQYLIVGGVAMNLLGCPRFTNDIDVLLALDEDNLHTMKDVMKKMGYEQRLPISLDEIGDEKKALQLIKEKNLLAYTYYHPKNPLYSVDVIVGASLRFDQYRDKQVFIDMWDLQLPVISIDDLIGLKRQSDREKDAIDVSMTDVLPESSKETRCLHVVSDKHEMPVGVYVFSESYCSDYNCDCRRVFINVFE